MRTPVEIYEKYRIPPWLQMHQLRVAAVAKMTCEASPLAVDKHAVISACLLHDMGAIVKFDFNAKDQGAGLQDLYPKEEVPYWRTVQEDMRKKYGEKEHPATEAIIKELQVSEAILQTIQRMGFSRMHEAIQQRNVVVMIAQYGDMRVGPYGIQSFHDRLLNIRGRYEKVLRASHRYEAFQENFVRAAEMEKFLFEGTALRPEDINDETAAPIIEELRKYPVS